MAFFCRLAAPRYISLKMAACRRAQLLLLLTSLSFCVLCGAEGPDALNNDIADDPAAPPKPPAALVAEPPPARDAPAPAASQPRRATGWKLSEEEACREDLARLCPKHTWTNNLAVLECLQDRTEVKQAARAVGGSLGDGGGGGSPFLQPIPVHSCSVFYMI